MTENNGFLYPVSSCKSVDLRSERIDGGNGLVYTIYLMVTDSKGNMGTTTAFAIVPVNQSGTMAIDNGAAYIVNSGFNTSTTILTMNTAAVTSLLLLHHIKTGSFK